MQTAFHEVEYFHEYNLGKIWKTRPRRCLKNTLPEVFCIKLSFMHLISNGLNEVINLLMQIVALL